jgi:hypothetical protein
MPPAAAAFAKSKLHQLVIASEAKQSIVAQTAWIASSLRSSQ